VALCALAVGLCYANSLSGPFVLDDPPPGRALAFGTRPLVWASFALNRAWSGGATWSYHLVNALALLACGLALLGVLRRLVALVAPGARGGLALAVTLLWLCHPLQTSATTYISQRAELLAVFFYLGTLYGHLRALDSPARGWRALTLVSLTLGFLTKEIVATAPALMLLTELVLVPGRPLANLRARWRFHTLVALLALGLFAALIAPTLFADGASAGFGAHESLGPLDYLRSQPGVILHYLGLVFWPHPLVFDYGWPVARELGAWLPQTLVLLALLALTLVLLLRRAWSGYALAAFFLVLAPTSSVVPIKDLAFEHRMVLPLAAVLALVVAGGARLLGDRARTLGPLCVGLAALALGAATVRRNRDYRTALELWTTVVERAPANPRGHRNRAAALIDLERYDEAEQELRRALELDPRPNAVTSRNLAAIAAIRGQIAPAIEHLQQAVALEESTRARCDLARLLLLDARAVEAQAQLQRVLELEPGNAEAAELLERAQRPR